MATGRLFLPVLGGVVPTATPAYLLRSAGTNFAIPEVAFADATDTFWNFAFIVPGNYASAPVLRFAWRDVATSGSVVWTAAVCCLSDGDAQSILTDSFDTANSATHATNTTASGVAVDTITLTNADSMAANDVCFIKFGRDGDNGADDTGQIAYLVNGVYFEYTTT